MFFLFGNCRQTIFKKYHQAKDRFALKGKGRSKSEDPPSKFPNLTNLIRLTTMNLRLATAVNKIEFISLRLVSPSGGQQAKSLVPGPGFFNKFK